MEENDLPTCPVSGWTTGAVSSMRAVIVTLEYLTHPTQRPEEAHQSPRYILNAQQAASRTSWGWSAGTGGQARFATVERATVSTFTKGLPMDFKNDKFAQQVIAELVDAQEQAPAALAGAVGDVIGRQALSKALEERLAKSKAAAAHPMRDRLLATAVRALRAET